MALEAMMSKRDLVIKTADGEAKAGLFLPEGAHKGMPGVILFMDAFGPRPALDGMAERLAAAGYAVLVPDLFYRFGDYGPFDTATAFTTDSTRAQIMSMLQATTHELTTRDNEAFIATLTEAGADKIGAVGYCMGGARALTLAAKYPERVVAAASFHGGNLASDAPDSPHLGAASIKARLYIGCAGVDRSFPRSNRPALCRPCARPRLTTLSKTTPAWRMAGACPTTASTTPRAPSGTGATCSPSSAKPSLKPRTRHSLRDNALQLQPQGVLLWKQWNHPSCPVPWTA
jgi:carboxymethylenebutenolidase